MINCMNCNHAKPFAGTDGRIDFSRKLCKEGPPTPVIVGVDPTHRPVVQYLHPIVDKNVVCDRHDLKLIGEKDDAPGPGTKTQ